MGVNSKPNAVANFAAVSIVALRLRFTKVEITA